jgi:hypothetical protein
MHVNLYLSSGLEQTGTLHNLRLTTFYLPNQNLKYSQSHGKQVARPSFHSSHLGLQASPLNGLITTLLPPELHLAISKHVPHEDMPNYRLVNKLFADIGIAKMFDTVKLRFTGASVSRFKHIREDERFSKAVRTLVWDTDLWSIGVYTTDWDTWFLYCRYNMRRNGGRLLIGRRYEDNPVQHALWKELLEDRKHFEAHRLRLEDEKQAMDEIGRMISCPPSSGFELPNLKKVQMVNTEARTQKPLTVPLVDCKGDYVRQYGKSIHGPIVRASIASARELHFDGLSWIGLWMLRAKVNPNSANANITSITIQFREILSTERDHGPKGHFDALLLYMGHLRNLRSLHLDFGEHRTREDYISSCLHHIRGGFELPKTPIHSQVTIGPIMWPNLRKMTLRHFDTTSSVLLSLIARHNLTLRELGLHNTTLFPEKTELFPRRSWPQVLRIIGSITHLESVVLSGRFGYNDMVPEHSLNFNDESVAGTVASWIINEKERLSTHHFWEPDMATNVG